MHPRLDLTLAADHHLYAEVLTVRVRARVRVGVRVRVRVMVRVRVRIRVTEAPDELEDLLAREPVLVEGLGLGLGLGYGYG